MVLFEKIFSNDKRDATCSPCGYPCSCITVLCFHEQAEARYLILLCTFISLHTIYVMSPNSYLQPDSWYNG